MSYYTHLTDLPDHIKEDLPLSAQVIYFYSFNLAYEQHLGRIANESDQENNARQAAWAAVEKLYLKDDQTGRWRRKPHQIPQRIFERIATHTE